ncbi:MAG: HlyD family secretion protein [Ferrovum sp.]|jgi:multidrug resistance efflux pump|nr:HlyD family secretion protein [Ferrovum sp.]NDU87994.1 HlyD family secretion protein [Ferrovum sp.]
MKAFLVPLIRPVITLCVVVIAFVLLWPMVVHYQFDPWTRDGRVRADIVQVDADVSGLITKVLVVNDQMVHKGDVLFVVDRARYELACAQAEARLNTHRAEFQQAQRENARNHALGNLVATETLEQGQEKEELAKLAQQQAQAELNVAHLNLDRTEVRAMVDGMVSNLTLRPGDYVATGHPGLALIDSSTLHVEGYFEETKLRFIAINDPVVIHLMGEDDDITGHVQSISGGIEDRERGPSTTLLANVNPTFSWIRLAQRVPVWIALDHVPRGMRLIAGRTATVTVVKGTSATLLQSGRHN